MENLSYLFGCVATDVQQRLTKMAFLRDNFLHLFPLEKPVTPESAVFMTRHFR